MPCRAHVALRVSTWRLEGPYGYNGGVAPAGRSRWRYAPIAYAAITYLAAVPTFGAGIALAVIGFPLSVLHLRHVAVPRGLVFWIGFAFNALFFAATLYWLTASAVTGEP